MIVITGATGALNGATVDHLLDRMPAREIAVAVRDVTRADRFAARGVQVRHADYAEPASLPGAFADAEQLLLVSSSDPTADHVALHRTAIDAAVSVGVGRVLYTSHQGAAADTPFGPGRGHAATEQLLAESGLPWTSLRNGFYAHTLQWALGRWRETGFIDVPADGPMSWTARGDAAAAAAVIIADQAAGTREFDGPTTLTAADAPTFADIAVIATGIAGRPVECRVLGDDAWIDAQVAGGQEEFVARFMLGMYQAAAGGFFAGTDPLLGELLGREPETVRDVLEAPAPTPAGH
ncbi:NAD(P)H-binding protein [Curtobacterium sp. Leaf261]|uniref:NAD(P)H-binding protein n=1 Tax=Curtobacterium sp. Leaf261 TaxID=1736311 RepID=UPI0006F68BA6|nr:NAD(P)H-binding protein [Curtobacterium sp. Leaf261]KQO64536.1 NAD(P)-dependent oxidoreductase [Curtobacterium sp. Leaf261]